MATYKENSFFRNESHIFFIYDHKKKTERDDPMDAILYFYPRSVSEDIQIALTGGLIASADFCIGFLPESMPSLIKLSGHNFALLQHESFIIALSGNSEIPDQFLIAHMQYVWSTFIFYQGSLFYLKQRVLPENFLKELNRIWDMYLPLCQLQGGMLSQSFQVLPSVQLHKSHRNLFLHASHILQRCVQHKSVYTGAIFNKNRVMSTLLSNDLTRQLLLLMTQTQFPCVEADSFLELPCGVRLLHIFLTQQEYNNLGHRRRKNYLLEKSPEAMEEENKEENRALLSENKIAPFPSKCAKEDLSGKDLVRDTTDSGNEDLIQKKSGQCNVKDIIRTEFRKTSPSTIVTSGTDSEVFVDTLSELQNDENKLSDILRVECQNTPIMPQIMCHDHDRSCSTESGQTVAGHHICDPFIVDKENLASDSVGSMEMRDQGFLNVRVSKTTTHIKQLDLKQVDSAVTQNLTIAGECTHKVSSIGVRVDKTDWEPQIMNTLYGATQKVNNTEEGSQILNNVQVGFQKLNITEGGGHRVNNTEECPQTGTYSHERENKSSDNFAPSEIDTSTVMNQEIVSAAKNESKEIEQQLCITNTEKILDNSLIKEFEAIPNISEKSQVESSDIQNLSSYVIPLEIGHVPLGVVKTDGESSQSKVLAVVDAHGDSGCSQSLSVEQKSCPGLAGTALMKEKVQRNETSADMTSSENMCSNISQVFSLDLKKTDASNSVNKSDREDISQVQDSSCTPPVAKPGHSCDLLLEKGSGSEKAWNSCVRETLARSKKEIDASLDPRSHSGDESSNHSYSDWRDRDSSMVSLATSDVGPSKCRLHFDNFDSENSEGGIISPFSEQGRLSPVAESMRTRDKVLLLQHASRTVTHDSSTGDESMKWDNSASETSLSEKFDSKARLPSMKFEARKEDLKELILYVQGHSDTLLVLMLSGSVKWSKNQINSLWKSCLSHLAELDFELTDAERHMPDDTDNLGSMFQYMKYDSFSQNLKGTALNPVTSLANEIVDSSVKMHDSFMNMPDLQDITYRSHSSSCFGRRVGSSEVFFQLALPPFSGGIYPPNDKTFTLEHTVDKMLQNDSDIFVQ